MAFLRNSNNNKFLTAEVGPFSVFTENNPRVSVYEVNEIVWCRVDDDDYIYLQSTVRRGVQ